MLTNLALFLCIGLGCNVMKTSGDPGAFGPKTLRVLSRAYKVAMGELRQSDQAVAPDLQDAVARNIVDQAKSGERNPFRLAINALRGLATRK